MLNKSFLLLLVICFVGLSLQGTNDNEVDVEDVNPFAEAASAILRDQNAQNIGSMVNSFLQSGGAKQLGDILSKAGGAGNAGQLLQGLGNLMGGQGQNIDPSQLLQGIGTLMGGAGGQNPGVDPAILGSLFDLISNQQEGQKERKGGAGFDLGDLISFAGNFLTPPGQDHGEGEGNIAEGLMDLLPSLLSTFNSFVGPEADERAESHANHAWLLPPFLEKLHIMFDHFIHSDMGKNIINNLGAEKIFKIFTDEKGRFDYEKFGDMMENHSFRRHWIRMATDRIADFFSKLSDPKLQKKYLASAQILINSLLQTQNFPKSALFDPSRPTESISAIVNYVGKKYFNMKFNSKEYVKPAVDYVLEIYNLSKRKSKSLDAKALSDKLTDTINLEVIEPVARVNRAFRFSKHHPDCQKYVLCLVNEENQNDQLTLPGLKKLLTRGSSFVASWFLVNETGVPFWEAYEIITANKNCKKFFKEECNSFHLEEVKVTTEYIHQEL